MVRWIGETFNFIFAKNNLSKTFEGKSGYELWANLKGGFTCFATFVGQWLMTSHVVSHYLQPIKVWSAIYFIYTYLFGTYIGTLNLCNICTYGYQKVMGKSPIA